MGNNTASEEEFEVEKVEGGQWVKWTVPLVLLILVLALVTAAILSERPRTALDNRNIVLCVLTALLCTLVAVSLTLMGCAESSSQTEQHLRSVAAEVTTSRDELLRLGQAGLRGSEEVSTKTSRLEENQRLLRDKLAELKNAIETEHNALRKTAQGHKQELAESIGAVTLDQQTMHTRIDGLQQAGKLMSEKITLTADNQESLRGAVQEQSELLGDRMSSLAAIQEQLDSKLNTAVISLTKITDEQASLGGTLRDNACTLTQKMQIIEQFQQTSQAQVSNVAEANQQMIASIEAMIVEQSSLREMTGTKNDELTRQIVALSENQKAALATLGENLQQAATGVGSIAGRQDNIENTINANRQESLDKLATITHTQEHWGHQLDTTEAQVHTTVETISKLQEQVTAILAMLNTCTQSLTDLLDADNKHQVQLEGTINQNLTAITDLVSQIQEDRTRRSRFKGIGLASKSNYQGWCVPSMYV